MSDRRVKYIILASIIFVGIVGISQGQELFELNDVIPVTPTTSFGYLGHVSFILKDPDGNIKAYRQADNTVVDTGRDCAADLVFDTGIIGNCSMVKFMAIGTSTAPIMFSNTNLFDKTTNGNLELFTGEIQPFPDSKPAGSGDNSVLEYQKVFIILAADSGETVGEAGLFDSATEGTANMFARSVFTNPAPVTTDDQLTIRWVITTVGINI